MAMHAYDLSLYFGVNSDFTGKLQEQYTEFSYTVYPDVPNINFLPHLLHHSLPLFFAEPRRVSADMVPLYL